MKSCPLPGWRIVRLLLVIALTGAALPLSLLQAQQLIASLPLGGTAYTLGIDSRTGKVYAAVPYLSSVFVIDESTLSSQTIEGVTGAGDIAVDEATNKIYVTGGGGITIIDGATNGTTSVYIQDPGALVVNEITNKIYTITPFYAVVIDGTTLSTQDIQIGQYPVGIAVDQATNKIYVANQYSSSVTVIDGATNNTTTVNVPAQPTTLSVNEYTNKIYVLGQSNGYLALGVIDGATLSVTTVPLVPDAGVWNTQLLVDKLHNKVYVMLDTGQYSSYLAIVDGSTLSADFLPLGNDEPTSIGVEPLTDKIYIGYVNYGAGMGLLVFSPPTHSVSTVFTATNVPGVIAADSLRDRIYMASIYGGPVFVVAGPLALRFVPLTPCRVVDTRLPNGPLGGPPIQGGTERDFPLPQGQCGILASASAYSLNATVVPHQHLGYLTVWPTGETQPNVSTMNSVDGRVKANAAIVPAGLGGSVSAYASDTTDVILDINGYFASANAMALAYYPLNSCRVVDTRGPNGPYLTGGQERDFPILGACDIPSRAQAYALNVTALPHHHLGYLTVWPEGQQQPLVSTLNAPTGATTANAALVTAGTDGEIAVYPSDDTDLLIDVNGYFAPLGPGGMSLYTVLPCRALDTRQGRGAFSGITLVDMVDSGCNVNEAEAYVLNATVVPRGPLGYLAIWPTTEFMPPTSTLNAADGVVTSNLAIVPNIDGWLDVFASNPTNLIIDAFGYFAP